jgi:hypothetical protein
VPIPLYRSDGALVSWISPILATPPQHCISLNKARMLKGILLEKLPPGSTVAILGAPAGAFGGEDYDEKWLKDNLASHDRPLVLRIRSDIGQVRGTDHISNAAALATAWMRSPREAFESIYAGCGATQTEIDTYHFRRESVSQAISGLYR